MLVAAVSPVVVGVPGVDLKRRNTPYDRQNSNQRRPKLTWLFGSLLQYFYMTTISVRGLRPSAAGPRQCSKPIALLKVSIEE